MGASQSSGGGESSSSDRGKTAGGTGPGQDIKRSYYELVGVERNATDEEIKKAYRRKALELHPDRNFGDVDRATKLFAEVQVAYEVLSDPQERAWYDSHEEAILYDLDPDDDNAAGDRDRSSTGAGGPVTSAADIMHLFRKFHGNVDFSDAPSGFYGFLRETFAQLAREEEWAARRETGASSPSPAPDYPSFGHREDEYEAVVKPFYAAWGGFATRKSFAWRDKYRPSDAPDRRVRRLIEKENQRARDEGVREFNDAVRSLVAFVRKRDPRYKPNTQSEAERQQALRDAVAAQAARQRAANAAKANDELSGVPAWAQSRDQDEVDDDDPFEQSESEEEQFECVACRKIFKSENQFEAHERSKKHIKTVNALRRRLQKENKAMGLDDDDNDDNDDDHKDSGEDSAAAASNTATTATTTPTPSDEPATDPKSSTAASSTNMGSDHSSDDPPVDSADSGSEDLQPSSKSGSTSKIRSKKDTLGSLGEPDGADFDDAELQRAAGQLDLNGSRTAAATQSKQDKSSESRSKGRKNQHTRNQQEQVHPGENNDSDGDDGDGEIDETLQDKTPARPSQAGNGGDDESADDDNNNKGKDRDAEARPGPPVPKMGKAAQKRAKKAAQAQAAAAQGDPANPHKCANCNAAFPSKTRLFQHIEKFGHAAPVAATGSARGKHKKR